MGKRGSDSNAKTRGYKPTEKLGYQPEGKEPLQPKKLKPPKAESCIQPPRATQPKE